MPAIDNNNFDDDSGGEIDRWTAEKNDRKTQTNIHQERNNFLEVDHVSLMSLCIQILFFKSSRFYGGFY